MAESKNSKEELVEKQEIAEAEELAAEVNEDAAVDVAAPATAGDVKTAKAGKRSAKAIEQAQAEIDKEARKAAGDTSAQRDAETGEKKGPKPIARPRLERRGKQYQKAAGQVEKDKYYALKDALELAATTNPSKFDASVELHVLLGVDPRQADQNVRSTVSLPHGTGKTVRVAVFAPADEHKAAQESGADIVGEEEFLQQLDKNELNFDILIATPQLMPRLGKYARVLGPRGLMPNPKSGTVATNVAKAVKEATAGRVEYRVDKQAIVHLAIGKASFGGDKLNDNAKAFFDSLNSVKPNSLKVTYIKSVTTSTTMGPGIKVDTTTV